MTQVTLKAIDTADKEYIERRLEELEAKREYRSRRIQELQMLKREAEKADALIQKLRDENTADDEEYRELTRLYYGQN